MKVIIRDAARWLKSWAAEKHAKRVLVRDMKLRAECERRVQVCEFDGSLYLCLDRVPLMDAEGIQWDLPTVMTSARTAVFEYEKQMRGWDK